MKLGETLAGRFELTSMLGRGTRGEVFAARDLRTRRAVAVKVFDPARASSDGFSAMTRLLQAASRVAHPAVALPRIHSALLERTPFVVGDLIEGDDLAALATRGPLPWQRALDIMLACCDGLTALATATGAAHRALKPGNLRLASDGSIHVLDFGVAELGVLPVEPRADGSVVEYRAPEQLGAAPGDGSSDVFAIGVLLFELIAGVHPYSGLTAFKVGHKLLTQKCAPKLSESVPRIAIPSQVETLVLRALARSPGDRFKDPAEFSQHLALVRRSPGTLLRSRAQTPHSATHEEVTHTLRQAAPPEELTTMLNVPIARVLQGASPTPVEATPARAAGAAPQAHQVRGAEMPRELAQPMLWADQPPLLSPSEAAPSLVSASDPQLDEPTSVLPRLTSAKTALEPAEATVAFTRRQIIDKTLAGSTRPADRRPAPDTTLELPNKPVAGPVEPSRRAIDSPAETEATTVLGRPPPLSPPTDTGSTFAHERTEAFAPMPVEHRREITLRRTLLLLNAACLLLVVLVVYLLLAS